MIIIEKLLEEGRLSNITAELKVASGLDERLPLMVSMYLTSCKRCKDANVLHALSNEPTIFHSICLECGNSICEQYEREVEEFTYEGFGTIQIAVDEKGIVAFYTIREPLSVEEAESLLNEINAIPNLNRDRTHVYVLNNSQGRYLIGKRADLSYYRQNKDGFDIIQRLHQENKLHDEMSDLRVLIQNRDNQELRCIFYKEERCKTCLGVAYSTQSYETLTKYVSCLECGETHASNPDYDEEHTWDTFGTIQVTTTDRKVFGNYSLHESLTEEEIQSVVDYVKSFPDVDLKHSFVHIKKENVWEYVLGKKSSVDFYRDQLLFKEDEEARIQHEIDFQKRYGIHRTK